MRSRPCFTLFVALGAIALPSLVVASVLDNLQTFPLGPVPANGTSVDFAQDPLPADFFGPGSQPFGGLVYFQGQPIMPEHLGFADTRIERASDPFDRNIPPGPTVVPVPIELVQLSLRSIEPIQVVVGTETTFWDVTAQASSPQPQGQMQAVKTHPNGGTFDSFLPVQPVFTFTRVGNPGDQRTRPSPQPILLDFQDVPWVHEPYPALGAFGALGSYFIPGVEEVVPGDRTSQQRVLRTGQSLPQPGVPDFEHTVSAADGSTRVPGASTIGLAVLALVLAGAGVLASRGRRAGRFPVAS